MRNLKKLLAVIVAICILASFTVPAFAADSFKNETKAQKLYDLKLFSGTSTSGLVANLGGSLTREQGMMLLVRLLGYEKAATDMTDADTILAKYSDYAKVSSYAKKHVAYAIKMELVKGTTTTTIGPGSDFTGDMMAAVILRELGFKDVEYTKSTATLAEKKVLTAEDATKFATKALIRDDAVGMMFDSLQAADSTGKTIIAKLVAAKIVDEAAAIKAGVLTPAPPALAVDSVTATNLKEIVVTFNTALDKATVVAANFTLSPAAGTLTPSLSEDGKKVTITTGTAMANQGKYKLTAEKVATVAGEKLAKVTKEFTAFDATLPTVESIKVTGPKTFDVMFSEPIGSNGTVTIKSANTTLAVQNAPQTGTNKVTVTLYTALVDGTSYDVTIQGYADFAGYNNVIKTIAYAYVKDAVAPVVSLVSANQQYVVVQFNKPVTGLDLNNFYHTFSAWKPMGVYATKADMDAGTSPITTATTNVTTVYVQFATTGASGQFPLQPGAVNVNVLGKVGSVEVKDNWGSALASVVLPATVVADLEAPKVTKVEATSNTNIAVTFSKAVAPGAAANYEVLKSDGTAISGLTFTVVAESTTKVNLGLSKSLLGETVVVNVKNIEDTTLNKNKLVGTSTTTITFEDKEFAGVNRVEFDAGNSVLYVIFNEAMNDSAIAIANYKLNDDGTIRSLAGPATFFSGNKVVKVELSATEVGYLQAGTNKLLIANVIKDLAGNGTSGFQLEKAIDTIGAVKPAIVADGIKAIDKNTVTVQFDQELVSVLPTNFTLSINASGANTYVPATSVALTNNSTGSLVTLTFTSDILANVPAADVKFTTLYTAGTVNVFGQSPANVTAVAVADKIAPKLVTKELTNLNTITLTYDEFIKANTISVYTYTVAGNTVTGFVAADNSPVVTLTLGTAVSAGATPSVTQALDITDISGNKLAASAAVTVADKVLPTAIAYNATTAPTSFKVVSATSITVVFTEKLDATKFVANSGFAVAGAGSLTSATLGSDGVTVTLTGTGFVVTTSTVAYTAPGTVADIIDLAGNKLATFGATATN